MNASYFVKIPKHKHPFYKEVKSNTLDLNPGLYQTI